MLTAAAISLAALSIAQPGLDQAPQPSPEELRAAESRFLTNPFQLTFADDFVKAGESYFSHDGELIVFQGVPVPPEGEEPSPHYGMYLTDYTGSSITESRLVSPTDSANTCGWFHPHDSRRLLFGSTLVPPSEDNVPGYQRASGRYSWAFPSEMELVEQSFADLDDITGIHIEPEIVFEKPGYTAECSYSPDGRHILYANVDEAKSNEQGRPDADLWIFDTETQQHTLIVEADGYDGGPFFSPDGTWICYRSDRQGNNLLQLFVAELEFDESGAITGIKREVQLTNNRHVNWAPFFHPSGDFLVYASSEVSHRNYEVFAIALDTDNPRPSTPIRVTHATGFDGLPVFNPDGTKMMWTAQRGDDTQWGGRASSQLWIADFDADAVREALAEANPTDPSE
ncbi:MAG: hypothetical protein AAFR76_10745 [Planctomycetota bacterium]